MPSAPHRIRQQRWQIRVSDAKAAFSLRAELRTRLDSDLLPLFEQALDALNTGSERVHIPKLVLQLRVSSLDELATALPAAIQKQLEQILLEHVALRKGPERKAAEANDAQQLEDVLGYLQSGALNWVTAQHASAQTAPLAHAAAALAREWRSHPGSLRALMPAALEEAVAFFFRWLQLLPEAVRFECSESLMTGRLSLAGPVRAWLSYALLAILQDGVLAEHGKLLIDAVRLALAWASTLPADAVLVQNVLALPGMDAATVGAVRMALGRDAGAQAGEAAESNSRKVGTEPRMLRFTPESTGIDPLSTAILPAAAPQAEPMNSAVDTAQVAPVFSRELAPLHQPGSAAALWVQAAGVVLLHPFLPKLLATLGVLHPSGETIAPSQLPRAAALLHWLAWGRAEVFEFELGSIKVLLGLRPEDPLPLSAGLVGDTEREECEALLEAAISHWSVLRSTSVSGLRTSFLQRAGLLRVTDLGWQLQLEPASFDVLLTQLPWSFGTVKFKWMSQPLFTEWGSS